MRGGRIRSGQIYVWSVLFEFLHFLQIQSELQVVGEVMIREHDLDAKSMLNSDYLFQIRAVGTYLLVCACRCGVDVGCLFGEIDSYYQEGKVN